jgi:Protein of unknown function (DUF1501)
MTFDSSPISRRAALKGGVAGFGYLAFAGLSALAARKDNPLAPRKTHFPARAKHVIFLCMEGAPSHVDTFDYKPKLADYSGRRVPGTRTFGRALPSPWKFQKHGKSGMWVSELFPNVSKHVDKLCVLNGMHTDVPAHSQAFLQMHTGVFQFKRPSMGAWTFYGLGTENENLPGFITMNPPQQNGGPANYGSAFLPAVYQGTPLRTGGGFGRFARRSPFGRGRGRGGSSGSVANIRNPQMSPPDQRRQLDFIQSLNKANLEKAVQDPAVEGAIESLELAFRMQKDMPKVMDTSNESAATRAMYGLDDQTTSRFGQQCLLARKFVEAGVRFVEITSPGWDHHFNLKTVLPASAQGVDKPIAGLLQDLAARGLLKETLVIWGGEFGRTPYAQGNDGRDHNHRGFTMWMAGGGTKGGYVHGATDDFGYQAVSGKVHIHDWHATILHLLGLDHERLTYRYAGREMRLTDVKGNVVKDIIA